MNQQSFHEAIPEPEASRPGLWHLPELLDVRALRRYFRKPRITYAGLQRVEHETAIELTVTTDAPFPVRALSPALYVGEEAVIDYDPIGAGVYRFFAYNPEQLKEGAPIALGWPGDPEQRRPSSFRYELVGEATD